jgi:hypothetical protein
VSHVENRIDFFGKELKIKFLNSAIFKLFKFPSLIFYCWCEKATPVDENTAKSIFREKMIKYPAKRELSPEKTKRKW